MADNNEKELEFRANILKYLKEQKKEEEQELSLLRKKIELLDDEEEKEKAIKELKELEYNNEVENLKKYTKQLSYSIELRTKELEEQKKLGKLSKEQLDNITIELEISKEILKEELKKTNLKEKQKEQQKFLEESIGRMAQNLLGISKESGKNSFLGRFFGSGFSLGSQLKVMGKELASIITPTNLFVGGLEKLQESTIELVREQESAVTSFNRATGAAGKYNDLIRDIGTSHISLGIDTEKSAKALEELKHGYVDFNLQNVQTQKDLVDFTAQLEQVGISSETTGKNFGILTKQLGMSTDSAMIAQKEILATAKALGVAPSKMAQDFTNASSKLSVFGSKAIEIFKKLAVVSKSTGMEVDKILQITDRFDTFEGAGDAVSRLNTILRGPYLDAMEMIEATDPKERFEKVKDAIDRAGKSFDSLSYYEKKAMASALEMSVSDMALMMNAGLEEQSEAAKQAALSQEELNKIIKAGIPFWEKFKALALSIAIPVAKGVNWLLEHALNPLMDSMLKLVEYSKGWASLLLVVVVPGILFAFTRIGKIITSFIKLPMTLLSKGTEKIFGSKGKGGLLTEGIEKAGKSAQNNAKNLLSLGAAILMIGGGVFLAAFGISKLAESMKGMNSQQIMGLVGAIIALGVTFVIITKFSKGSIELGVALLLMGAGIALATLGIAQMAEAFQNLNSVQIDGMIATFATLGIAIAALAIVATGASFPLLALGGAIALIGVGIYLASSGMSSFVESIKGLSLSNVLSASMAIKGIASAMKEIIPITFVTSMGINSIVYSFNALSISLNSLNLEKIKLINNIFTSISAISNATVSSLGQVGMAIKEIAKAIEEIPSEKAIKFNSIIDNVRKISEQGTKNIQTKETIKNTMSNIVSNVNNTSNGFNGSKSSNGGSNGQRTIILQLGDRVLKKFVIDVLNEEMGVNKIY